MGKDFSTADTTNIYGQIAEATAPAAGERGSKSRREYTAEERHQYAEELKTSGRKGAKMPRINIALAPSNVEYVETMAQVTGMSKTAYINLCLKQHREEHGELYRQAQEFRRNL